MKRVLFAGLALALILSCGKQESGLKISIFCDHIEDIASQKNISFAEAATLVREIGYTGVDVWVNQDPAHLAVLDSLGFEIPCAIAIIDLCEGEQPEETASAKQFMKSRGIKNLLLVPGFNKDSALVDISPRLAAFAAEAASEGFTLAIEDYDNFASPCCGLASVKGLLDAAPELGCVFDSGNYLFCGEDCMRALPILENRVSHVHLKDRVSGSDMTTPAVGTGCIPITFVIQRLVQGGYDGWFTVEFSGLEDMYDAAVTSFNNVKTAIEVEQMEAWMSEYYYPEIPVVEPVETCTAAPEGAKILFDGTDEALWCGSEGQDAAWTLNGDGTMTVDKSFGDIRTREEFGGKYLLHIEWCVPEDVEGENQSRGNSGVFLNGAYEVQVLDTYGNKTYVDGWTASIYKQSVPAASPIRKPGEWNVYDITFTSPVLNADGTLAARPRVSVVFNGVTVQDDFEILGTTEYIGLPRPEWKVEGPISLQSHGDPSQPISFRNIWIKQL